MKASVLPIACIAIFLVLMSCSKDNKDESLTISGELIQQSECKNNSTKSADSVTSDTISKIEYQYNSSTQKLKISHINAGFNCCPGTLSCVISQNGDTILIEEQEEAAQCHCDCLYDLEIEIDGVAQQIYHIKVFEPYAIDQAKLSFEIDLDSEPTGSFSVIRKSYPWGLSIL
jgi:hypothetical protein